MEISTHLEFIDEEIRYRRRKYLLIFVATVIGILAIRSFGLIRFELFAADMRSANSTNAFVSKTGLNRIYTRSTSGDHESSSTWRIAEYGIGKPAVPAPDASLASEILKALSEDDAIESKRLKVVVDRYEITGGTWVPIFKVGNVSYTISVWEELKKPDQKGLVIDGNVEISAFGAGTSRKVEVLIREMIRKDVVKIVREDLNKNENSS
jgi:hypothetical protein